MINIRSFNTHIFALIFIILITILTVMFFELVKPDNIKREFNYDAFPNIKPTDLPEPTLASGSSCLSSLKACNSDIDCGDCGDNFACTDTETEHIVDGVRVPAGKFCLPKKDGDAICNVHTGKWVWASEGGDQNWKCVCRYPSLYTDSDSGCTKQVACGDSTVPLKFQSDAPSDSGYSYKKGDVWDPVNSQSENLSVNPFSTFKDSNGNTLPLLACDCTSSGNVRLPNDPYVCHPDYCTNYDGNENGEGYTAAVLDENGYATGDCDCENAKFGNETKVLQTIPVGKLRGLCYNPDRVCKGQASFDPVTGLCSNSSSLDKPQNNVMVQCNSENVVWDQATSLCANNSNVCNFPKISFDQNSSVADITTAVMNTGKIGGAKCDTLRLNFLQQENLPNNTASALNQIDNQQQCTEIGVGQPWRCKSLDGACISTLCQNPKNAIGMEEVSICNENSYNNTNISPELQKQLGTSATQVQSFPNLNILSGVKGNTDESGNYLGCKPASIYGGANVTSDLESGFRGYTVSCPPFQSVDCATGFNNSSIVDESGKQFDSSNPSCFGSHTETPPASPSPDLTLSEKESDGDSKDCAGNPIDLNQITLFPGSSNFSCESGSVQAIYPPGTVVSRIGSNLNSAGGNLQATSNFGGLYDPNLGCDEDYQNFDVCLPINKIQDNENIDNLMDKTNFGCNMQGFDNVTQNLYPNSMCLYGTESVPTNTPFSNDVSGTGFGDGSKISRPNTDLTYVRQESCYVDVDREYSNLPADQGLLNNLTSRKQQWAKNMCTPSPLTYCDIASLNLWDLEKSCQQHPGDNTTTANGGPIIDSSASIANMESDPNKNSTLTNLIKCKGRTTGASCRSGALGTTCPSKTNQTDCVNYGCSWGYCQPTTIFDNADCNQWNVTNSSSTTDPANSVYEKGCKAQTNFVGVKQCTWVKE